MAPFVISVNEYEGSSGKNLSQIVSDFFGESGALSQLKHFEYRPQQQRMAVSVARAMENSSPLVIEAETGVGKSLAYLAPSVELALRDSRKAIISTHTINLQEQLIDKDIPLLRDVLGKPFTALLLKGRRNYLCPNRLSIAMSGGGDLFTSSELEEIKAIWKWSQSTQDGSLSDLDFVPSTRVWSQVCSEGHACTVKHCAPTGKCFYQEVRKQVEEADVLVLNHTLFFTLLANSEFNERGNGFLFANDFLVMDEAHTLEDIAAKQLGLSLSQAGLKFDLHRLYNPKNSKGLFSQANFASGRRSTIGLLDSIDEFFEVVDENCEWGEYGKEFRIRRPEFVEDTLGAGLIEVGKNAREIADLAPENSSAELLEIARRMGEARSALSTFLDQSDESMVYWVEKNEREAISLNAAPVDVSEILRPVFFAREQTSIFTSATLGVGDRSLNYFRNRVGAEDTEAEQIGSPFDFQQQMTIHLVKKMPMPGSKGYEESLQHWIEHFVKKSGGRAFVLFTSYRLLQQMTDLMERFFDEQEIQLLSQGRGRTRKQLIKEFKEDETSVLFGTASFWTGVDVPGNALKNVIITRLPFAVPSHPLTQAKMELIEDRGGSSFMEYSVPEAILKLRQGVGRLIRRQEDEGMVVLLDNRILSKHYGKLFLNALPDAPVHIEE